MTLKVRGMSPAPFTSYSSSSTLFAKYKQITDTCKTPLVYDVDFSFVNSVNYQYVVVGRGL